MIKKLFLSIFIALLLAIGFRWEFFSSASASNIRPVIPAVISDMAPRAISNLTSELQVNTIRSDFIHPAGSSSNQALLHTNIAYKVQPVYPVKLVLFGPAQVDLAQPFTLQGILKYPYSGLGIANMTIDISSEGFYLGQTHTDYSGGYAIKITKVLRAGKYYITASFKGAHTLAPASETILVEILPATVQIQTIPAVSGITFQMAGQQFTSGTNGSASITILQAGQYQLDVLLDKYQDASQQVEFGRWAQDSYQPSRMVNVPADNFIQVGLNVFHRVAFKFVDLDGYAVDPSRISSISIRSVQGDVFTLKPGDTPWLPSSRTARRSSGLQVTDLLYSVNRVVIDGSNVVNSAQQRFFVKKDDNWTITLLLYAMQINVKDGLFASPVGKSIDVIFPNGQVKNYPLDQTGALSLHTLARGIYHVSLLGVQGLGTSTPVALSRNQVVKMNIVTKLDVLLTGGIAFGFALGLVLYGRPQLIKNIFRRKRPIQTNLEWTADHENQI